MLLKLRGVLFVSIMSLLMVIYWPVAVLGGLFLSEHGAYRVATLWGRWVTVLLKYILGITYKIHGAEHIPEKACVVLSKHQSALDIFVLLTVFDPQTWVFKKELFNIPCFGWALWATKPIAIDRNAGRKALSILVEKGKAKLAKGFFVLLYPEGTRTKPGEQGTYKSGGVLLAKKTGVDVVPVALNTGLFWQKGTGVINSGVVDIVVGEPIDTITDDVKTITTRVEQWIEENALAITLNHPHYIKLQQEKLTKDAN